MKKGILYAAAGLLLITRLSAQLPALPANDYAIAKQYPFVRAAYNHILNDNGLDSFYEKLYRLRAGHDGKVSVVHIGDSHIQADFLSGVVRNGLQDFFGNAGRGLVFPYQLAKSNAPDDISSSSNISWQFNRVAHPEISIPYGISGYGLVTGSHTARINLSVKPSGPAPASFDRLKLFLYDNTTATWTVEAGNNSNPYVIAKEQGDTSLYQLLCLDEACTSFSLSSSSPGEKKELYGVSLENAGPGLIYHTLGVNGARYDQYNIASLFWKQLPALEADLYIISLGTNEAQAASFSETGFIKAFSTFIEKLREVSPYAAIMITTAPDSYKRKKYYNTVLKSLNATISRYCDKNNIPLWDLYRITGGYGSAGSWARRGLMNQDRIHFTAKGYRLQGDLLLSALAKSYNRFQENYAKTRATVNEQDPATQ